MEVNTSLKHFFFALKLLSFFFSCIKCNQLVSSIMKFRPIERKLRSNRWEQKCFFFIFFFSKKDLKENIFSRERDMIFESFFSLCWWIEEKQLLHFILISQKIKGRIFYSSLTPKTCNYFVFLKLHILYAYLQIFQTILKTSYWRYEFIPTTVNYIFSSSEKVKTSSRVCHQHPIGQR
jgi:hypothetical protein